MADELWHTGEFADTPKHYRRSEQLLSEGSLPDEASTESVEQ